MSGASSPRVVITGANGFVGRNVVRAAVDAGLDVVGIVRSEVARSTVIQDGGRPIVAPLQREALAQAMEGVSAVVHLAQIGAESGDQTYESVNVAGTREVVAAARAAGVGRIVFFSGLGVAHYGVISRCTNTYFLSKLSAENALFRSGLGVVVFRPSYVIGPGDALMRSLLGQLRHGRIEWPGDAGYRLQPIAVQDAARLIVRGITHLRQNALEDHRVFDLVGPERIAYRDFVARFARIAQQLRIVAEVTFQSIPIEQAEAAAEREGFHGMRRDALDCLLCDEISDARPLESLLSGLLMPLDDAIRHAVRGTHRSGVGPV